MFAIRWLAVLPLLGLFGVWHSSAWAAPNDRPRVEVVFCLDTTGSMTGLIDGAKRKIWSIANQIVTGTPTPEVRIGLVGYRDRQDDYVTKLHPITTDLDEVFKQLSAFRATGGGDEPESVNQALHEAVTKTEWSTGDSVLRIIFLVGDAPPHMDYKDDVKYEESCRLANEKGIRINTVLCGDNQHAKPIWQVIAHKTDGSFLQIAQQGGVVTVETPFDKELAELNVKLMRTNLCWGSPEAQQAGLLKNSAVASIVCPSDAADNAGYRCKVARVAANDLLDDLAENKIKLEAIKEEELPADLKKMKPEERQPHVTKLQEERSALKKRALELDKQRLEYLVKHTTDNKDQSRDGFDNQVIETLRKQGTAAKIKY